MFVRLKTDLVLHFQWQARHRDINKGISHLFLYLCLVHGCSWEFKLFWFQTRVLVTHGISFLPQVGQIVVIRGGKISEVKFLRCNVVTVTRALLSLGQTDLQRLAKRIRKSPCKFTQVAKDRKLHVYTVALRSTCVGLRTNSSFTKVNASGGTNEMQVENLRRLASPFIQGFRS